MSNVKIGNTTYYNVDTIKAKNADAEDEYISFILPTSISTQAKTVRPTTSDQMVEPDEGYVGLSRVKVTAIQTETKSVTPSTANQRITPATGKYLSSVDVAAIATETKVVTPTKASQVVTPADGKYITKVTVNPVTSAIDEHIIPGNIKDGIEILGVTGTLMPDKLDQEKTVNPSKLKQTVTPDAGYDLASVTINPVTSDIDEFIKPENIKSGIEILGVAGNLAYDKRSQNKTVTPSVSQQIISPDTGYELTSVTVEAIPTETKTQKAGTTNIHVIPTTGKYLTEVVVQPTPTETLTFTPKKTQETLTPSTGKYFSQITVNAVTSAIDENIKRENIREGVSILGVEGSLSSTKESQTKIVTPSKLQQIITPDTGKELTQVTVNKIPDTYIQPTGTKEITANGTAIDVRNYANVDVAVPVSTTEAKITEISAASEMSALLITANVGKIYKYVGDTTDDYAYGNLYEVMVRGNTAYFRMYGLNPTSDNYFAFTSIENSTAYSIAAKDTNNMPVEVIIPPIYNNKAVTAISDSAFSWCGSIVNIIIPNGITKIGQGAFDHTPYYTTSSNWEDDVLYIDNYLISAKDTVSGIYQIKSGTVTIADAAFDECTGLTGIILDNSVKNIGFYTFYNCTKLTKIYYKGTEAEWNSITIDSEGNSYFADTATKYYYSEAEPTISGNYWHYDIDGTTPVIWESVPTYEYLEFTQLSDNTCEVKASNAGTMPGDLVIPSIYNNKQVVAIADNGFKAQTSIATLVIPDTVRTIGTNAFYSCDNLTEVTIPGRVSAIQTDAFQLCTSLVKVNYTGNINQWVQIRFDSIDSNPLAESPGMAELYIDDQLVTEVGLSDANSINNYAFCYYQALTHIWISGQQTSIGDSAFEGCTGLTNIIIPESIRSIGSNAFAECENLQTVTCSSTAPSALGSSAFNNLANPSVIYVPAEYVDIYAGAEGWGDYADGTQTSLQPIPQYTVHINLENGTDDPESTVFTELYIDNIQIGTIQEDPLLIKTSNLMVFSRRDIQSVNAEIAIGIDDTGFNQSSSNLGILSVDQNEDIGYWIPYDPSVTTESTEATPIEIWISAFPSSDLV